MSIRLRFALSTALIMILLLLGLSMGIHYTMARNMQAEMDDRLSNVFATYKANPDIVGFDLQTQQRIAELAQPDPFAAPGLYIQAIDRDLRVQAQTTNLDEQVIPIPSETVQENLNGQPTYYERTVNGNRLRVYSAPLANPNGEVVFLIQVAESLEPLNGTLGQLRNILIIGSVIATIAVAGVAWFTAHTAMRPLTRMTSTARAIGGADDLSERIDPPATRDEVQQLAETFNAMLDRLESTFNTERRFVADASHELRTPLTALRGNAEILLQMSRNNRFDPTILTEGLTDISSEADRLNRLVQDLLTLARADVGWRPEMQQIELVEIAREATRITQPLAQDHILEIDIPQVDADTGNNGILLAGSADQLKQLFVILLDNALTHTPEGSRVSLRVRQEGSQAIIAVEDSGPGIDQEHLERIFDRFFRTDDSRSRTSGGTGLGLAIAKWIVSIHNGTISVDSVRGHGSTFTVWLPAEQSPSGQRTTGDAVSVTRQPAWHSAEPTK